MATAAQGSGSGDQGKMIRAVEAGKRGKPRILRAGNLADYSEVPRKCLRVARIATSSRHHFLTQATRNLPRRLPQTLLILDERQSQIPFPASPKPHPELTATSASSSSFIAKSIDPMRSRQTWDTSPRRICSPSAASPPSRCVADNPRVHHDGTDTPALAAQRVPRRAAER